MEQHDFEVAITTTVVQTVTIRASSARAALAYARDPFGAHAAFEVSDYSDPVEAAPRRAKLFKGVIP